MSAIPAASASANLAKSSSSCSTNVRSGHNHGGNNLSFRMPSKNNQHLCHTKALRTEFRGSIAVTAQLNEVSLGESSDSFPNSNVVPQTSVPNEQELQSGGNVSASNKSISEFIAQVTNLVKLVDSKDIVELHLKQLDCEVTIRKKEALSPAPASSSFLHSSSPQIAMPPYFPPSPIASTPNSSVSVSIPSSNPVPSSLAVKSSKSSFQPLKCPMAGTFYRCPGPGEPQFVKVGDKVKKGQVLCIIEAMKLMNEIEADQSGTVVEILVDDGKPVSVDTPLFLIEP